jgi:hypothetical protein
MGFDSLARMLFVIRIFFFPTLVFYFSPYQKIQTRRQTRATIVLGTRVRVCAGDLEVHVNHSDTLQWLNSVASHWDVIAWGFDSPYLNKEFKA